MNIIKDSINKVLYGKGIYWAYSRCWWACIVVAKKLPKDIRNNLYLVEDKSHYWLEDLDGNIYDIYSQITGYTYTYNSYVAKYKIPNVLDSIIPDYELCDGYHSINYDSKLIRIPTIDNNVLINCG